MSRLAGKTAIVTGAGNGIGEAIAARFANEGCATVLADIDDVAVSRLADEITASGGTALAVPTDVTKRSEVEALAETAESEFGCVDVVVNNAGVFGNSRFELITDEQWHTMMNVNVGSVFVVTQTLVRRWLRDQRPGAVINMASVSAHVAFTDSSHYSASKAAITALTRCVAAELGPYAIRVNCIAPGIISTAMTAPALAEPELNADWMQRIPLRRYGTPEDVAAVAVFLASDDAVYINGEVIVLDGGASPSWPKPSDRHR